MLIALSRLTSFSSATAPDRVWIVVQAVNTGDVKRITINEIALIKDVLPMLIFDIRLPAAPPPRGLRLTPADRALAEKVIEASPDLPRGRGGSRRRAGEGHWLRRALEAVAMMKTSSNSSGIAPSSEKIRDLGERHVLERRLFVPDRERKRGLPIDRRRLRPSILGGPCIDRHFDVGRRCGDKSIEVIGCELINSAPDHDRCVEPVGYRSHCALIVFVRPK
jgi:hypothetical protein